MANFDPNRWYQLLVKSASDGQSMDGTSLFNNGGGAVFFQITNTSDAEQQWQLYPYNSSFYVLRTKASGPDSAMNVFASDTESTPGGTVPAMHNFALSDDSKFWQISPWGDGTFFLTNAANGTAWHLLVKSNSLMAMSSNITLPQDGQSFSFNALGIIDDDNFSSLNTPSATANPNTTSTEITTNTNLPPSTLSISASATMSFTSTSFASTATSSSSATTPSASSQKGLSSTAAAAVGASIGGAMLIAAFIISFVLYQRRKRRSLDYPNEQMMPPKESYPLELNEMEVPPAELHGEFRSAELQEDLGW